MKKDVRRQRINDLMSTYGLNSEVIYSITYALIYNHRELGSLSVCTMYNTNDVVVNKLLKNGVITSYTVDSWEYEGVVNYCYQVIFSSTFLEALHFAYFYYN